MEWLLKYWPILLFCFNCLIAIIFVFLHKTYAKKETVNDLDMRLTVTEKSVIDIEKAVDELDTHNIELQIKELKGEFEGMNRLMNRAANQLDMLVENELKGPK
jgi:hypothetical protein